MMARLAPMLFPFAYNVHIGTPGVRRGLHSTCLPSQINMKSKRWCIYMRIIFTVHLHLSKPHAVSTIIVVANKHVREFLDEECR